MPLTAPTHRCIVESTDSTRPYTGTAKRHSPAKLNGTNFVSYCVMTHLKKGSASKGKKRSITVKVEEISLASQLFEETIELAEEEDAISDAEQFAQFIVDMIPADLLNELKVLAGICGDDNDPAESNTLSKQPSPFIKGSALDPSTFRFLEDIWSERFQKEVEDTERADWDRETNSFECELCDRFIQTTRHHLYPKETHDWLTKKNDSRYTTNELRKTIALCRMCHSAIHRFHTNKELAIDFCSLELLLDCDQVCKFAKWASSMQGRGNLRTR